MVIRDIYRGTSRYIRANVRYNGALQDISGDTMNLLIKRNKSDENTDALLNVDADCLTSGSSGVAIIYLSPAETDITAGNYYYELLWTKDTGEKYIGNSTAIEIKERVYKLD